MTTAHEPNEEGFAGEPTTPEVEREHNGEERQAVPDSDLTSAFAEALSDATEQEPEEDLQEDADRPARSGQ